MIEKFIGNNLEKIGIESFEYSYFLKEVNLKNVKEIGEAAFFRTSLNKIKNNHI